MTDLRLKLSILKMKIRDWWYIKVRHKYVLTQSEYNMFMNKLDEIMYFLFRNNK